MTTRRQPSSCASPVIWAQKVRQRSWGSVPMSSRASPASPGRVAEYTEVEGHTMCRTPSSSISAWGREEVKSKNSSGSISATSSPS